MLTVDSPSTLTLLTVRISLKGRSGSADSEFQIASIRTVGEFFEQAEDRYAPNARGIEPLGTFLLALLDLNEIALGVLDVLREELNDHGVVARTELAPELPLVPGHSGQLQEVLLNLVRNSIEAMDSVTDRARVAVG